MWVATYGEVLSIPINGPYTAKQEWSLPIGDTSASQVSVVDGTVAVVDTRVDPRYSEYDLTTGKSRLAPCRSPGSRDAWTELQTVG